MKSIFVSHVYEDQSYLFKIKKWVTKGILEDYVITHEIEDKRIEGPITIKK